MFENGETWNVVAVKGYISFTVCVVIFCKNEWRFKN